MTTVMMPISARTKIAIADRFGQAAKAYDEAAGLQRESAADLADRLAALTLPPAPRILEIGCGTGHLTRFLLPRLADPIWIASDIASAMIAELRRTWPTAFGDPPLPLVMDGERPACDGPFDLILGNFVWQWFLDPEGSLQRLAALLAPGGFLAFTTLGPETFPEWRAAHRRLGLQPGTWDYPDRETWLRWARPSLRPLAVEERLVIQDHASARDFLLSLRAIGADRARPDRSPLSAGHLRRILIDLDREEPCRATYQVLTFIFVKAA